MADAGTYTQDVRAIDTPDPSSVSPGYHESPSDPQFMNSAHMRSVMDVILRVAPVDASVLILGESGVGKELVARAIHFRSPRRERAFVKVNCAAVPAPLLESELFGYERGAFTGAYTAKPGKFELAHLGTMFLDEVAELPLSLQAKLLCVLQDGRLSRLGSREDVQVQARLVAATNKDITRLVDEGKFREDLYYRLNVVRINVPPLRERREEIPVLIEQFLDRYAREYGRPRQKLSAAALKRFMMHRWPGNVRELENAVKRTVVLGSDTWVLDDGTQEPWQAASVAPRPFPAADKGDRDADLSLKGVARRAARDAEAVALEQVLKLSRWNRAEAARRLQVSYRTLRRRIVRCGLED
ncbi:MAG: sigma 54-interacting transcriptional regulator [Candidatus Rokubacteria bacterium]|nr:sigma 54-interacting transcriptional regulator [Candidatus Rokubacteria bacterium]